MNFPDFFTDYKTVLARTQSIDPQRYSKTRNFLNGEVSYLSPFITHGVISTKTVMDLTLKSHKPKDGFKLFSELGWREFFHRVWQSKEDEIFGDLRYDQTKIQSPQIPTAIVEAQTGIETVDQSIRNLKEKGYMHNHARMWVSSITGNIGQTHWYEPAKWLHYHLLDGDLASNTLSWQWIVGSFSHKKYYANQENINKYGATKQTHSFIDIPYAQFDQMDVPEVLSERTVLNLTNEFPESTGQPIEKGETIFLHSVWNLDPTWRQSEPGRHILWIDPKMHERFPMSPLRWKFITHWANQIPGLEIFVGSPADFFQGNAFDTTIISREYPLTKNWPGQKDDREWCFPNTQGYFKNFFSFWKEAQKELPN